MEKAFVHVRVPGALYKRFRRRVAANNQSVTGQVIELMELWLAQEEARRRQAALLDTIRRNRWMPPASASSMVELVREDRDARG
ncbi:MAG: hypothetical protein ACUVR3_02500 [Candidatus Roseilinea sp.]|uniref:hypothetical protein n=1 Tax=Candidatus Roseilinea sp. TaxID=2838777 RepID=UPI00404B5572